MIHPRTFLASSMAQFASEPRLLPLRDQDEVFLVPGTQAVLVLDPSHSSSLRSQGHDRWIWCDSFQCWIYTPDAHVTDEYLRVLEREHFDVPPDQTQNLKRDRWLHVIALVRHQGRELERVRRRAADLERRLQFILDVVRGLIKLPDPEPDPNPEPPVATTEEP